MRAMPKSPQMHFHHSVIDRLSYDTTMCARSAVYPCKRICGVPNCEPQENCPAAQRLGGLAAAACERRPVVPGLPREARRALRGSAKCHNLRGCTLMSA